MKKNRHSAQAFFRARARSLECVYVTWRLVFLLGSAKHFVSERQNKKNKIAGRFRRVES